MMLFFWLFVFIILILIASKLLKKNSEPLRQDSIELLKIRYAKGEIDKTQFETMKQELLSGLNRSE